MDSTKPPLYYQNFEWTIFIHLPQLTDEENWIGIEVFSTKAEAESVDNNFLFVLSNQTPDGSSIWTGMAAITMQVVNNSYILDQRTLKTGSCDPALRGHNRQCF